MAEEMNMQKAREVFGTLVKMLDTRDWKYEKHEDKLLIKSGVKGDDLPVEFIVVDYVLAQNLCGKGNYSNLAIVEDIKLGSEIYAIGFRKNDPKLRDEVQRILSEMKADGTLGEISTEWFGSDVTTVK